MARSEVLATIWDRRARWEVGREGPESVRNGRRPLHKSMFGLGPSPNTKGETLVVIPAGAEPMGMGCHSDFGVVHVTVSMIDHELKRASWAKYEAFLDKC